MDNRTSGEVRDRFVLFPKLLQLMTKRTACSLKNPLSATGRDKILLDAPWPALCGGVFMDLRRTHGVYTFWGALKSPNVGSRGKFSGCWSPDLFNPKMQGPAIETTSLFSVSCWGTPHNFLLTAAREAARALGAHSAAGEPAVFWNFHPPSVSWIWLL